MITIDDFKKLDIRIGRVLSAEKVTEKLIKLIFDLGSEQRQIMAGMGEFFDDVPQFIGKEMPLLLNIQPATFRGFRSEGMILAADVQGKPILLRPEMEIPLELKYASSNLLKEQ